MTGSYEHGNYRRGKKRAERLLASLEEDNLEFAYLIFIYVSQCRKNSEFGQSYAYRLAYNLH